MKKAKLSRCTDCSGSPRHTNLQWSTLRSQPTSQWRMPWWCTICQHL